MKIPIEALELVRFASTNENRTTLEWMRLRSSKGTQQMEATTTDGHMLAQVTWTPDDLEGLQNFEAPKFLSADEIRTHLKRAPKKDRLLGGEVTHDADSYHRLQLSERETASTLRADEIRTRLERVTEGDADWYYRLGLRGMEPQSIIQNPKSGFPDASQVIPPRKLSTFNDKKPQGVTFGMDLYLIQRAHDWVKATNNHTVMTFTGSDSLSPFRMDLDLPEIGGAVVFVVMPCRI